MITDTGKKKIYNLWSDRNAFLFMSVFLILILILMYNRVHSDKSKIAGCKGNEIGENSWFIWSVVGEFEAVQPPKQFAQHQRFDLRSDQ